MGDKFSILTASYNSEKFITSCINSVLKQTHKNWEMIIVDDMSSDKTYDIIKTFSKQDERIKVYKNDQKLYCGLSYKRCLDLASGDFCGILDSDDMLKPHAISTVVDYYYKYPKIDFIWTQHDWCNLDMKFIKNGLSSSPKMHCIYKSEENFIHVYSHWRTFKTFLKFKAELFKDMKCTVDKELGYSLEEVACGGFLDISLYKYRYHKNNMSHLDKTQKTQWVNIRNSHKNKNRKLSISLKLLD